MHIEFGDYIISDDKAKLDVDVVQSLLKTSYWAGHRSLETIVKSIVNSLCIGVYLSDKQVGFARLITDGATMYWLCDVLIDEAHRGKGIGKKLIESIVNWDQLKGLNGILGTRDAHGLYEKYGFIRNEMMRRLSQ
jgi:GNAT superfamily N-acetyltransferase